MDLKEFIQIGLDRHKQATLRIVEGLTYDEMKWRPGPGSNSIGIILLHQARFEDTFIQTRIMAKPQVWEAEKWYEKMHLTVDDTASRLTLEQITAFKVPEVKLMLDYAEAVRTRTLRYVKAMDDEEIDRVVNHPRFGDVSVGFMLNVVVTHLHQHAGDMSYIRGLQRGLDK